MFKLIKLGFADWALTKKTLPLAVLAEFHFSEIPMTSDLILASMVADSKGLIRGDTVYRAEVVTTRSKHGALQAKFIAHVKHDCIINSRSVRTKTLTDEVITVKAGKEVGSLVVKYAKEMHQENPREVKLLKDMVQHLMDGRNPYWINRRQHLTKLCSATHLWDGGPATHPHRLLIQPADLTEAQFIEKFTEELETYSGYRFLRVKEDRPNTDHQDRYSEPGHWSSTGLGKISTTGYDVHSFFRGGRTHHCIPVLRDIFLPGRPCALWDAKLSLSLETLLVTEYAGLLEDLTNIEVVSNGLFAQLPLVPREELRVVDTLPDNHQYAETIHWDTPMVAARRENTEVAYLRNI